jgi:hypothetical protein
MVHGVVVQGPAALVLNRPQSLASAHRPLAALTSPPKQPEVALVEDITSLSFRFRNLLASHERGIDSDEHPTTTTTEDIHDAPAAAA